MRMRRNRERNVSENVNENDNKKKEWEEWENGIKRKMRHEM